MNNSDETLKKTPEGEAILQAIAELSKIVVEISNKLDNLKNSVTDQFDAIQERIAYNSVKFDRLEAKFYEARSDISNLRADIKELTQVV